MKKILTIILTFILFLCFFSCDNEKVFRYDLNSVPKNLDSQMADDTSSKIILNHVMQGLLKEGDNGDLICDAALEYKISDNGKTYTFILKENLKWSDGSQVVADDFVFAFERIFLKETNAPDKSSFLCIKNAQAISNDEMDISHLGVRAINTNTLEIKLENANPRFLYTLTTTAAYPCKRDYFYSTKGKYGYNGENLLFNGVYIIQKKTDDYIQLAANPHNEQYEERQNTLIVFYTKQSNDYQTRFLEEITDFSQISQQLASNLDSKKFDCFSFESSTWVLGFNQNVDLFKNQALRKAMFSAIFEILPNTNGIEHYTIANGFVVSSIEIDSVPYRSLVDKLKINFNDNPKNYLSSALNQLEITSLPKLTLICPDEEFFKYYSTYIQKSWKEKLGIIVNFVPLTEEEYYKTLYQGNFDLAIFPIAATENNPLSQLEKMLSNNNHNYIYYTSDVFQDLYNDVAKASTTEELANKVYLLEQYLVEDAVILPLVFEKNYVAVNKSNIGIRFLPFGPKVDFKNADKK